MVEGVENPGGWLIGGPKQGGGPKAGLQRYKSGVWSTIRSCQVL